MLTSCSHSKHEVEEKELFDMHDCVEVNYSVMTELIMPIYLRPKMDRIGSVMVIGLEMVMS